MVGDTLRQAREKQGLTIADVAGETSIREAYLEAIEKGNYDELPGDVYAKGFIRNYSKFLQIDGDALLQEYNAERKIVTVVQPADVPQAQEPVKPKKSIFGRSKVKEISPQEPVKAPEPPKQKTNLFSSGDDYRHRLEREEKSGSRKFMILLAVMVVFLGGVYIAFMDDGSEDTASKAPAVKTEQQNKQESEKKVEGIEIKAKLLENCWISVKVDGTVAFEGTAEKGKEFTWKGKNTVEITAGNAGGIEITENGKAIGKLGEAGQVAEKTFKAEIPGKDEPATAQNSQQSAQENSAAEEKTSHESRYTEPEPQPEATAPAQQEAAPAPVVEPPAPEPAAQPAAESAPANNGAAAANEG